MGKQSSIGDKRKAARRQLFFMTGGILYPVRTATAAEEVAALLAPATPAPRAAIGKLTGADIVALMAHKIVESARARGEVDLRDIRQAGIPENKIEQHRDAAMARARRLEPKLDAMVAQP